MFKNISILLALYIASLQDIMAAQQQYENRIEVYNPGNARVHDNPHNLPLVQMPVPVQYQNNGSYQQQTQGYSRYEPFNHNAYGNMHISEEDQKLLAQIRTGTLQLEVKKINNAKAREDVQALNVTVNKLEIYTNIAEKTGDLIGTVSETTKKVETAVEDNKNTIGYVKETGSGMISSITSSITSSVTYLGSFIWSNTPTEEKKTI